MCLQGEARIHFHCDFLGLQVSFHPETVTMFGNSVVHALKQAQTMQRHLSKALRNRSSRSKNVSGIQKPEASGPPAVSAQSQGPHDHESVMRMVQSLVCGSLACASERSFISVMCLRITSIIFQFTASSSGGYFIQDESAVSANVGL